jgi:hypothetical protein
MSKPAIIPSPKKQEPSTSEAKELENNMAVLESENKHLITRNK